MYTSYIVTCYISHVTELNYTATCIASYSSKCNFRENLVIFKEEKVYTYYPMLDQALLISSLVSHRLQYVW